MAGWMNCTKIELGQRRMEHPWDGDFIRENQIFKGEIQNMCVMHLHSLTERLCPFESSELSRKHVNWANIIETIEIDKR